MDGQYCLGGFGQQNDYMHNRPNKYMWARQGIKEIKQFQFQQGSGRDGKKKLKNNKNKNLSKKSTKIIA